jgi:ComF family protein
MAFRPLSPARPLFKRLPDLLPALVPTSCALCGRVGRQALCDGCDKQYFRRNQVRCKHCASPLPGDATLPPTACGECLKQPPAFDATVVAADYAAPVDQLVLALKFGNQLALAPLFGNLLVQAMARRPEEECPDFLTAVPLGPQRLAERGFNQALEIARPVSRALKVALKPALLVRQRDTRAQSKLHPDERHTNIRNAFIVPGDAADMVRGAHIGVVDDVITTGETLSEVARTLKRFGARRVTNLVFARPLPK